MAVLSDVGGGDGALAPNFVPSSRLQFTVGARVADPRRYRGMSMNFVGREAELDKLDRVLRLAEAGRGTVVTVGGPAGAGKSRLLDEVARRAGASGACVIRAVGTEAERDMVPLGLVDQMLRSPAVPHQASEPVMQLLNAAPWDTICRQDDASAVSWMLAAVLREVWSVLHEMSRRRTVVILVDDHHLADDVSRCALTYLASRLRMSGTVLVLAEPCARSRSEHEYRRRHDIRRVTLLLRNLDTASTGSVLASALGADVAEAVLGDVHCVTRGNPALLGAVIADIHDGRPRAEQGNGPAYGATACSLITRSDPSIQRVAYGMAALGHDVDDRVLAQVTGTAEPTVTTARDELRSNGMLDPGDRLIDSVGAALLSTLSDEQRRDLHTWTARLLLDGGGQPEDVARQLLAAGPAGEEWVAGALCEAADRARDRDAVDVALTYLRFALLCHPTSSRAATVRATIARLEWNQDPGSALRHVPILLAEEEAGALAPEDRTELLIYLLWHGRVREAAALHQQVGAAESCTPHLPALSWLARLLPGCPGGIVHDATDRAIDSLYRVDDQDAATHASRLLECLSSHGTPDISVVGALLALIRVDHNEEADTWCRHLRESRNGTTGYRALLDAVGAVVALRRGAVDAAGTCSERALDAMHPVAWGSVAGLPLGIALRTAVERGALDHARSLLETQVHPRALDGPVGAFYLHARALFRHRTGDAQLAIADLQTCGRLLLEWGVDEPSIVPWRSDLALVLADVGDDEAARRLVADQLDRVPATRYRTMGITLRVQAALEPARTRVRRLQEALHAAELSGDELEVAKTLASLSQAHHDIGRSGKARKIAGRAHELALRCGAVALASEIRPVASPDTPGFADDVGKAATSTELSEAERRVAVLAAVGCTNVQIAERLYITTSTVEQHLTRTYRKLKVNRVQLPSALRSDVAGEGLALSCRSDG